MDLEGHREITKTAVAEFCKEYAEGRAAYTQMHRLGHKDVGPETTAVRRDIIDVLTLGHWSHFGQKHHFMRRQDGQTSGQAWRSGCEWCCITP